MKILSLEHFSLLVHCYILIATVNQEICIQKKFFAIIFMVFNFSYFVLVKMHVQVSNFSFVWIAMGIT